MAKRSLDMSFVLTVLVGAFLLLDGITGLTQANSLVGEIGRAFGARGSTVNLVVAIIELVAGALLLLTLFVNLGRLQGSLTVVILLAWIAVMVLTFVVGRFAPDTLEWWTELVHYSIILAVLRMTGSRA